MRPGMIVHTGKPEGRRIEGRRRLAVGSERFAVQVQLGVKLPWSQLVRTLNQETTTMEYGTVLFYLADKQFGFIAPDVDGKPRTQADRGSDCFFHGSNVLDGTELRKGDRVVYAIAHDKHGRAKAMNVELVE
jgi:cold shock CspA family protein